MSIPTLHGVSEDQWSADFLRAIGAPVNAVTVAIIDRWQHAESGGGGGDYNPLNTTVRAPGSTNFNSFGPGGRYHVQNFPDYATGVAANAQAFNNGRASYGYGRIRDALIAGNPAAAFQAIHDSSWGTKSLTSSTPLNSNGVSVPQGSGAGNVAAAASGTQELAPGKAAPPNPDDVCVVKLPSLPLVGSPCLFNRSQGRALLGGVSVLGGAAVLLVGLAIMAKAGGVSTPGAGAVGLAGKIAA